MTVVECRTCLYLASDLKWCSLLAMNVDGGGCDRFVERKTPCK